MTPANFSALVQSFFTDHLLQQKRASPHTIAGYRDSFRLLLRFAAEHLGKRPTELEIDDFTAHFVGRFLQHLETGRGNRVRTRNARLAALRSFFKYVAVNEPACALLCQRILAMPSKRQERAPVAYLDRTEVEALIAAPNLTTWTGRRDRTLLLIAAQTGLRVSELIGLRCQHVVLGTGAHVRCEGKGRKQRCTPLRKEVVALVDAWLRERNGHPDDPVFPSLRGGPLSRDGVERLVAKHTEVATKACPSLASKRVTPHVLRHTAAMDLLQHGVDHTVIALWLGHESPETTQIYLHADMNIKEKALACTDPVDIKTRRFRPDDQLIRFLEGL